MDSLTQLEASTGDAAGLLAVHPVSEVMRSAVFPISFCRL